MKKDVCANSIFYLVGDASFSLLRELVSLVEFIGSVTAAIGEALRHPRRIRWRETLYFMNMCGADGLPITALICFLMGVILGYQSAVQLHKYGADTFLPGFVGCSMVRELGPLMVAIIATGRAGSAFAAEIGSMKVSEEIDALRTMAFVPERFLVIPKLISMTVMTPLLAVMGNVSGIIGGMLIAKTVLGMTVETYLTRTVDWVTPGYFFEGMVKSAVFGIVITMIGCWRGFQTGSDALAVGRATTSAVVISIMMIIICDTALAQFFNSLFFG